MLNTVVHVENQEQWDVVLEYGVNDVNSNRSNYYNHWRAYGTETCIDFSDGNYCYSYLGFFKAEGYKILTFQEWSRQFLGKPYLPNKVESEEVIEYKIKKPTIRY